MEAELEVEKAPVSPKIYEEEKVGEERRDIDVVITDNEEHWQPPKSKGVADPGSTSGPFTVGRTPPLKPQVPVIPSLSMINYLNKTVSGSFTPHPKQDTLVVSASSCNSVQSNGYATSLLVSHLSSDK